MHAKYQLQYEQTISLSIYARSVFTRLKSRISTKQSRLCGLRIVIEIFKINSSGQQVDNIYTFLFETQQMAVGAVNGMRAGLQQ